MITINRVLLIDLFITRKTQHIISFSQSQAPFIASHDSIKLVIPFQAPCPPPKVIKFRRLQRVDPGQLQHCIAENFTMDPTNIISSLSLELPTFNLATEMLTSYDKLSP